MTVYSEHNRPYGDDYTFMAIIAFIILFVAILMFCSCTKPEYCMECHKKDGGMVIYCGTKEQFEYDYQWNCEYLKDTMDCKMVEK